MAASFFLLGSEKKGVSAWAHERFQRRETALAKQIKSRIRKFGPMTFRDFMATALYDSCHGFYAKGPGIGCRDGSFNTNAMFPAFAFAMARAIEQAESTIGEPLRIVEFGGGTGELSANILSFLSSPHEYVCIEPSGGLRRLQGTHGLRSVPFVKDLDAAPTFAFGNEVLDALPVHRVMGDGTGHILEIYVGLNEKEEFIEIPDTSSTPSLSDRLKNEKVVLGRGQVGEVCLELEQFLKGPASMISKGYLVFIDYGDEAASLYSYLHRNGTLRSYRAQNRTVDPFDHIGDQDLTADVDFTALQAASKNFGFWLAGFLQQGRWLQNLGIQEYEQQIPRSSGDVPSEVELLTHPAKLGSSFDVIAFKTSNLPDPPGFSQLS